MKRSSLRDQTMALSGIFQSAKMVQEIAWYRRANEQSLKNSIHAIFLINPQNTLEICGKIVNLKLGLQALIKLLDKQKNNDTEIIRYVLSLMYLEKKLTKDHQMQQKIRQGIKRAHKQAEIFSPTHSNVLANLASIYVDTISTYKFRVYVTGDISILNNQDNVNKIRCFLLSGIRFCVLWRQLGGSRWKFITSRAKTLIQANILLQEITDIIK